MMETIGDFISQKEQIAKIEAKLKSQRVMLHKARKAKDKAKQGNGRTVSVLIKLVMDGKLDLSITEIANLCFITRETVMQAKYKVEAKYKIKLKVKV